MENLKSIYDVVLDSRKEADRFRYLMDLKVYESLIEYENIKLSLLKSNIDEIELQRKKITRLMCERKLTKNEVKILRDFDHLRDCAYSRYQDCVKYLSGLKPWLRHTKTKLNKLDKK